MGYKVFQIWIAAKPHVFRDSSVLGGIKAAFCIADNSVQTGEELQSSLSTILKIKCKSCSLQRKGQKPRRLQVTECLEHA